MQLRKSRLPKSQYRNALSVHLYNVRSDTTFVELNLHNTMMAVANARTLTKPNRFCTSLATVAVRSTVHPICFLFYCCLVVVEQLLSCTITLTSLSIRVSQCGAGYADHFSVLQFGPSFSVEQFHALHFSIIKNTFN